LLTVVAHYINFVVSEYIITHGTHGAHVTRI